MHCWVFSVSYSWNVYFLFCIHVLSMHVSHLETYSSMIKKKKKISNTTVWLGSHSRNINLKWEQNLKYVSTDSQAYHYKLSNWHVFVCGISYKVLSEGLGNNDKVPCPRAILPLPADSNPSSTKPQNYQPYLWNSHMLSLTTTSSLIVKKSSYCCK